MSNALTVLEPKDLTELRGVAEVYAASGLFPNVKSMAQAFVKIQAGRELGFSTFASMNDIHIISGKLVLGAGLIAAAVKRSGRYDYQIAALNDQGCELIFFEIVDGERKQVGKSKFDQSDAKAAKVDNKDNWQKYPRNMYFARAISNGVRWYAPDVFMQPVYTPEEMDADTIQEPAFDMATGEIVEGEIVDRDDAWPLDPITMEPYDDGWEGDEGDQSGQPVHPRPARPKAKRKSTPAPQPPASTNGDYDPMLDETPINQDTMPLLKKWVIDTFEQVTPGKVGNALLRSLKDTGDLGEDEGWQELYENMITAKAAAVAVSAHYAAKVEG